MAINITPPNFAGTSAIAGRGINNAAITNPGALGLEAYQMMQASKQAAQQQAMQQMQMRQQGEIALRQQQAQRAEQAQQAQYQQGLLGQQAGAQDLQRNAQMMQGQQNAAENAYRQQALAQSGQLGQAGIDVDRQRLFQEAQKVEIAKMMEEKADKLKQKGAFAAFGKISLDRAESPAAAQAVTEEFVKEGLSLGLLDKEQAAQFRKMPIQSRKNTLEYMMMLTDSVGKYKELTEEKKKGPSRRTYNPDGSITEDFADPTAPVATEAMKNIQSGKKILNQFEVIKKGYKPEYFTNLNEAEGWTQAKAERNKGIPVLEQATDLLASVTSGGKSKEERAQALTERKSYFNTVNQTFNAYKKEITGSAAGVAEIEALQKSFINGEVSSSEAEGAIQQIMDRYKSEINTDKQLLNQGVDTKMDSERFTYYRNNPKYKDWSDDKLRRAIGE